MGLAWRKGLSAIMADSDGPAAGAWAAFEKAYDGWPVLLYLLVGHEGGVLGAVVGGGGTADEIAARAGSDPRMTLEWLRVMTVAGFVDVNQHGQVFTARPDLGEILDLPGIDSPAGIAAAIFRRTRHAHARQWARRAALGRLPRA
jgi:hypothetical protein